MPNLFTLQTLAMGYPVTTSSSNGRQTVTNPTRNVSGVPTQSTDTKYKQAMATAGADVKGNTVYPTGNLTGYPVVSSDPQVVNSLSKNNGIVAQNKGYSVILPTGNITGWPTLWQINDGQGNTSTHFVMPGFLNPGEGITQELKKTGNSNLVTNNPISYDQNGIPYYLDSEAYSQDYYSTPSASSPAPLPSTPTVPSSPDTSESFNSTQRRRAVSNNSQFSTFLGSL